MAENSELELSTKLSTLKEKGLISDDEYQQIASSGHFVERELLKLLVSKYQLQGANIWKIFEVLAAEEIPANVTCENNLTLQNEDQNEQSTNPLQETSKNPSLINKIVRGVFEFLTFEEVKQCRLVCHQWDFAAQPLLRRKGIVRFKPESLQPATFLEIFENKLPFDSFKFSNEGSHQHWSVSQIQKFFDKWGKNVKHLELMNIRLKDQNLYDITPWLEKTAKLTVLKVYIDYKYEYYNYDGEHRGEERAPYPTNLQVELDKLQSVKFLHLHGGISICLSKQNMMTPLEINLNQVQVIKTEGDEYDSPVRFNEYIDFSEATNIFLKPYYSQSTRYCRNFSMASQELKAKNVYLNNVEILNWKEAKGKIDSLTLFDTGLVQRNELEIKKLILNSCTIGMAIIPLSIQQIQFVEGTKFFCDQSVVLPELVFLGFRYITQNNFDMISRFACCKNLVEIEIEIRSSDINYNNNPLIVKVGLIPNSVKRMKIQGNIKLLCDNRLHTLDKLIVQRNNVKPDFLTHVANMLSDAFDLKVRVLVVIVSYGNLHWARVANFVKFNQQRFEKIVFGNLARVFKYISFEQSSFSRCVDRKSDCYEFQTNVTIGKAISSSDFNSWSTLTALQNS